MSIAILEFAFAAAPPPFVPVLHSTGLTPPQFESVMQPIIANILGVPAAPNPWGVNPSPDAWNAVRIGWQTQGQPAWNITDDVCCLTATMTNDPYSQVRDQLYEQNDAASLIQNMQFTQVWNLHFTLYGPNSYRNARQICSSMALDYAHDTLAGFGIYAVVKWNRPQYHPELFAAQWWIRTDLDLQFNENVKEFVTTDAAAGVDGTVITNAGPSISFSIQTQN
jgi:hypothetical protein